MRLQASRAIAASFAGCWATAAAKTKKPIGAGEGATSQLAAASPAPPAPFFFSIATSCSLTRTLTSVNHTLSGYALKLYCSSTAQLLEHASVSRSVRGPAPLARWHCGVDPKSAILCQGENNLACKLRPPTPSTQQPSVTPLLQPTTPLHRCFSYLAVLSDLTYSA